MLYINIRTALYSSTFMLQPFYLTLCNSSTIMGWILWWKWTEKKTNFKISFGELKTIWDNKTITIAMSILGKWVVNTLFSATAAAATTVASDSYFACKVISSVCFFVFPSLASVTATPQTSKHPNIEGYKSKNRMNVKVEMNACHHKKCEHIEPSVPSQTEIIRSLSHVSSVFHFHRCFSCRWISMAVKLADRDRYHGSNGKKKRKI